MKFHDSSDTHDYPFPTVTLAYFLRYPNPFAKHVLSTDVIDRHFDPATNTLYTARLHLKRSKIPSAILKLLPRSWLGANAEGTSQSYILERSIVSMRDGVMVTESKNLEFTGILAVVERQLYRRPSVDLARFLREYNPRAGFRLPLPFDGAAPRRGAVSVEEDESSTDVTTRVELQSRLGEKRRLLRGRSAKAEADAVPVSVGSAAEEEDATPAKTGFFRSWGTSSIQRSIEAIGLRRTERAVPNANKGMNIVLSRLRNGGLVAVIEGMRRDREGDSV